MNNPGHKEKNKTPFDNNKHATTKTIAKGLLNIALLTSNANQLKITIAQGPDQNSFYWFTIILTILSIILQTCMAILAVFTGREDINFEQNQKKATTFNRTLLILSILTIIINVLITSFAK